MLFQFGKWMKGWTGCRNTLAVAQNPNAKRCRQIRNNAMRTNADVGAKYENMTTAFRATSRVAPTNRIIGLFGVSSWKSLNPENPGSDKINANVWVVCFLPHQVACQIWGNGIFHKLLKILSIFSANSRYDFASSIVGKVPSCLTNSSPG
ncbi:hypothetical protein R83H12_00911 [Fibrobacteria bacterium R8-3-H12]